MIVHLNAITPVSDYHWTDCFVNIRSEKLPSLGRAMGTTLREFRSATKGDG